MCDIVDGVLLSCVVVCDRLLVVWIVLSSVSLFLDSMRLFYGDGVVDCKVVMGGGLIW